MSFTPQSVFDEYEDRLEQLRSVNGSLAADLLEERSQRREVGEALVRVTEERDQLADENLAVHTDLAEELHTVDDLRAQLDDAQATASMRTGQLMASRVLLDEAQTSAAEHSRRHAEIFDEHLRQVAQLTAERDEARQEREAATWLHARAMELIGEVEAERDEARDEVVRLGRENDQLRTRNQTLVTWYTGELERLRTIIRGLGAGEAAEPETEEQIEALRPKRSGMMTKTHGLASTYNSGCRCDPCTEANTTRSLRERAVRGSYPSTAIPHGTNGYVNYNCRCDICCEANRARLAYNATRTDFTHGHSGYTNFGCRCQICRDAKNAYQRAWHARRRAGGS